MLLAALDGALGNALVADAIKEATAAKRIAGGAQPPETPSPERQELERLKRELQRLRDELTKRQTEGAPPEEVTRRQREIDQLDRGIQRAEERLTSAEERARRRQAEDLARAADALGRGGARPGVGNGNNPGRRPAANPGGGSGSEGGDDVGGSPSGGTAGGGTSGSDGAAAGGVWVIPIGPWGIPDVGKGKGAVHEPKGDDPQPIYVRGEHTVWAWDRSGQRWEGKDFGGKILDVQVVGSGILVVAEHSACLYDFVWGEWLEVLEVPNETLEK
jgi:hypothetical protein